MYAIVRNNTRFEKLRDFTLDGAIAEVERIRQLKEEKLRQNSNPATASSATTRPSGENHTSEAAATHPAASNDDTSKSNSDAEGLSDKARGKRPESTSPQPQNDHNDDTSTEGNNDTIHTPTTPTMPPRQASSTSLSSAVLPGAKNGFIPTEDWVSLVLMWDGMDQRYLTWVDFYRCRNGIHNYPLNLSWCFWNI